ncbi:hypothetical protein SK128_011903 [Halocaridina rubra]|uniref:Uncharacterized protein n=1 Tax=Halocaridina rubra TaxID=373956 RepID=A0AAN8XR42_HALRR
MMTCLYSVQIYPSVVDVGIIYYLSCPNLSLYLSSRFPMLCHFCYNEPPPLHTSRDPTPQLLTNSLPHHNHHHTTTSLGLAVEITSLLVTQTNAKCKSLIKYCLGCTLTTRHDHLTWGILTDTTVHIEFIILIDVS